MRLRETPPIPSFRSSRRSADRPNEILTLDEAARLTNTNTDVLWEYVRAGRIPFTLASGSRNAGTVLVRTDDLSRAGLLPGRPGSKRASMIQPLDDAPRPTAAVFTGRRMWGAGAVAAVLALLFISAVVPSFGIRTTGAVGPLISGAPATGCVAQLKKTCKASSFGRSPKGTTVLPSPSAKPTSPVQSPGSHKYFAPGFIASDCSRDVTDGLIRWIQSVPNNSTLFFPAGGCFRIDGTVRIVNRVGLIFEGNGDTFRGKYHTQGKLPHIGVYNSTNITFRRMIVTGANPHAGLYEDAYKPPLQWEAAWDIEGSRGILLDSVQAYDLYGDFVLIQGIWVGNTPIPSQDITIQNSHFERNGRQGIAVTAARNVTITNNYIGKVRHSLLAMEAEWSALPIDNIRFTGNTTGGVFLLWVAMAGICNAGISNIYVADNVMKSDAGVPLFIDIPPKGCPSRGPFTIERNTLIVRQSPLAAFDFTNAHDVMVRDNKVWFDYWYRPRVFVKLTQSTRVSVLNNAATSDPRDTIVFVSADPGSDYVSSGNKKS